MEQLPMLNWVDLKKYYLNKLFLILLKTSRSKGYAFIEFQYKEVAEVACKALHGYIM